MGKEREREREKRLDKKKKRNAPQEKQPIARALSLPLPRNWLSKNLRQSKPPLNGTPRQTGLVTHRTARAAGLKNGRKPRVRATPYRPRHSNSGRGKRGRSDNFSVRPDSPRMIQAACQQPLPRVRPATLLCPVPSTHRLALHPRYSTTRAGGRLSNIAVPRPAGLGTASDH